MKAFHFGVLALLALLSPSLPAVADEPAASEQILVFTGAGETPAARVFQEEQLPALEEAAQAMGVEVHRVPVAEGVPEEVRITPLILFQNHRGRSIFQARTKDPGKLEHFIRTSRAVPPSDLDAAVMGVPLLERERSRTATPLKITALTGHPPEGFDAEAFQAEARRGILAGFEHLALRDEVVLGPSDRQFYMDFHPYLGEDGNLSITTALFSQFHCIDPVFTSWEQPTTGSWEHREDVFARAARDLEVEMLRQINESTIGDGFEPVPASVAAVSWEALGFPLPERPAGAVAADVDIELGQRWRIEESTGEAPRLIFRFPAPLERYTGEVGELRGQLELSEDLTLGQATGWIEAETSSVTMGEPSLDNAIHGKMIFVERFPDARFKLESIEGAGTPLAFGRANQFRAQGTFRMMGHDIPLEVKGEIEPIIGEDGTPRLRATASFRLRLKAPFGVTGPDGPEPANDTLLFYLDFQLVEG